MQLQRTVLIQCTINNTLNGQMSHTVCRYDEDDGCDSDEYDSEDDLYDDDEMMMMMSLKVEDDKPLLTFAGLCSVLLSRMVLTDSTRHLSVLSQVYTPY